MAQFGIEAGGGTVGGSRVCGTGHAGESSAEEPNHAHGIRVGPTSSTTSATPSQSLEPGLPVPTTLPSPVQTSIQSAPNTSVPGDSITHRAVRGFALFPGLHPKPLLPLPHHEGVVYQPNQQRALPALQQQQQQQSSPFLPRQLPPARQLPPLPSSPSSHQPSPLPLSLAAHAASASNGDRRPTADAPTTSPLVMPVLVATPVDPMSIPNRTLSAESSAHQGPGVHEAARSASPNKADVALDALALPSAMRSLAWSMLTDAEVSQALERHENLQPTLLGEAMAQFMEIALSTSVSYRHRVIRTLQIPRSIQAIIQRRIRQTKGRKYSSDCRHRHALHRRANALRQRAASTPLHCLPATGTA